MLTWMDSLKGRSMMRLASFTDEEMLNLIDLAAQLKARRAAGVRGNLLHRKNIALIFEKSSTRTRNSTLVAVRDEGGNGEYLTRPDIHFGKKESVKDTARVLGRIYVTREISIGDYVLTGGELPAAVIADAVVRLLPGALGDDQSALTDSFQDNLLEPPIYTRPAEFNGWRVPDVLLSGHAARIDQWQMEQV